MSEQVMADDSSHYEVSLTAGQAFVAFVLLLCSLAAAFVFGLMIGRGQVNDRLVVKREPTIINEASAVAGAKSNEAQIVELGSPEREEVAAATSDAQPTILEEEVQVEAAPATAAVDSQVSAPPSQENIEAAPVAEREKPVVVEEKKPVVAKEEKKPVVVAPAPVKEEKKPVVAVTPKAASQPAYVQLFSSNEAKPAEALAAKLIESGFTSAYVERLQGSGGMVYRVRVKFSSEAEARGATDRLRAISKTEPWITKQ